MCRRDLYPPEGEPVERPTPRQRPCACGHEHFWLPCDRCPCPPALPPLAYAREEDR